jgi:hypothetical protein
MSENLSIEQNQAALGTLLGTSYIVKPKLGINCYLVMRQSKAKNKKYLAYKASIFEDFARPDGIVETDNDFRWISKSHKEWNRLKEFCYNNGRKEPVAGWLDILRKEAFQIWYLERGFFANKTQICLRTTCFGIKGNKVIKQYFDELDMPCEIKKERNTGRILFTKEGTKNFLETIMPGFPSFMYYRLEERESFYNELKRRCLNI